MTTPTLTLRWPRHGEALIQGPKAARMTDRKQAAEVGKSGHSPAIVTVCHTDNLAPLYRTGGETETRYSARG